ncbi:hypothetical protein [Gordonia sp. MP11Mi]|uniref:Uncharacterized protein n=1 Tax=Gordonia sp. MP11Mi TaxID=3022769 RepID=A0AA97CSM3_9ACTN
MIPERIPYKVIVGVLTVIFAAIIGIVYANPGTSVADKQDNDSAATELSAQNASYIDSDAAVKGAVKKFLTSLSTGDIKTARQLSCGDIEKSLSAQGAAQRIRAESNRYRRGVELYQLTATRNEDSAVARGVLVRRKAESDQGWAIPTEFHLTKKDRNAWQVCSYRDSEK